MLDLDSRPLVGRRLAVVGLGNSGIAAARLAVSLGAEVIGFDARAAAALPGEVSELGIRLCLGEHREQDFRGVQLVIVSPGVPPLPLFDVLASRGVGVIGELDFAYQVLMSNPVRPIVFAVGGTNGKSTTTRLLANMLGGTGKRVFAGANLGEPLSNAAREHWDYVVLEVSSFQLERAPSFKPNVSVLLNISEDHLDRYPDFEAYAHAKGNAFVNQTREDFAVLPVNDALCAAQCARGQGQRVTFGEGGQYRVEAGQLYEVSSGNQIELESLPLHGTHNFNNLAAALAAARAVGAPWAELLAGLLQFEPLPHRMARVRRLEGVCYYDDSKATNVGASVTAIRGLSESGCVLIAGGRDKHGSYQPLVQALRERARGVVVLGEAADRIAAAVGDAVVVERARDMKHAVKLARGLALSGDAVLLSPACSSFDMYASYAARGDDFARVVLELVPA